MGNRPFILGNSIWITTVGFMQLFNDLEVRNYTQRYDGDITKRMKVDVVLDMKERIQHKLLAGGHKALEQSDTRLPRISIQIANIAQAMERYTGKNQKRTIQLKTDSDDESSAVTYDVQPFPIDIEYSVGVWCKYFEHYAQLLENIIGHFDPYATVGVKERNFGIERELKVEHTGVGQNSTFEMEGSTQRLIRGDLTFNVQTTAYKVLNKDVSELIEHAQVHIIDIITPISSETISISASAEDYLQ
jgi:hypothetical protein